MKSTIGRLLSIGVILISSIGSVYAADRFLEINSSAGKAGSMNKIWVMDGMTQKAIGGRVVSRRGALLNWKSDSGQVSMSLYRFQSDQAKTYTVKMRYAGRSPAYRLIRLRITLPAAGYQPGQFWDGYAQHAWDGSSAIERDNIEYTFPISCVWNGRGGMAAGFTPDTIISCLHSGISKEGLFYETKLVLDAKHPQTVTFVVYRFKPTFGYLDAVQKYYDMYPKWFRAVEGIDQRVYGYGGYIISSDRCLRLQLHTTRRAGIDWEWVYAPWVIAGDYYPEKQDWVEGRDVIMNYRTYGDRYKGTWEEYNRVRKAEFEQGDKTSAMFYYVLVKDADLDLVTSQYPDAQSVGKNGRKSDGGMNALPGERTTYVFPQGTRLADRIESEMRKVVKNYNVSGFAFDMANHGIDDYGPAQLRHGIGRSFDENGNIYSPDTLVGLFFCDAIHRMKRGSKAMGVIMNQAISRSQCFAVFHADGVMYEQGPAMNPQNVMPLRLMSGRKPMTFWGSVECARLNGGIRWDYMDDPECRDQIISQLSTHYLFTCLRIGASPMAWAARDIGYDWKQTIVDLKRAGWNPAPAVISTDNNLWIGRFGSGASTIISITNPKRYAIKADLTIVSSYLGTGGYAFVSDQGQQISQQVTSGSTRFAVDLKPKEIMILRTISLSNLSSSVSVTTARNDSTAQVNMSLRGHVPGTTLTSRLRDYLGFGLYAIEGLSERDSSRLTADGYRIELASDNAALIRFVYKPACQMLSPREQVLPFYSEPADNMCIVIPNRASRAERVVAEMLESYHSFVGAFKERPIENEPALMNSEWDAKPGIPIVTQSKLDASEYPKQIMVGSLDKFKSYAKMLPGNELKQIKVLNGGFIKIISDGKVMWIGGTSDVEISRAADIYFRLMDRYKLGFVPSAVNWVPKGYR